MPRGFAYASRSSAGSSADLPADWPFGALYPGVNGAPYPRAFDGTDITGFNWPNNWPIQKLANTVVVCDSPATLNTAGDGIGAVEIYITVNGVEADADFYENHLILITATHDGNAVNVQGPNDGAAGAGACVKVTNYAGNRWGFQGFVTFSIAGLNDAIDLIVTADLITATAVVTDTDNTDLIYS